MPDDLSAERVREIAREEVERGLEQVGIDATTAAGRIEHNALMSWTKERKRIRETGSDKVRLTILGGLATAFVTAVTTWLATFGFHR